MTRICIFSGSTLGSAEYVAEHLETVLAQDYETHLLHGPSLDEVLAEKIWLIVTSTHGAGELPENLQPLFEDLQQRELDLSNLRFAVIGLGNSDYDTFCFAAEKMRQALLAKSAVEICKVLQIDMPNVDDAEQFAEDWLPNFTAQLA